MTIHISTAKNIQLAPLQLALKWQISHITLHYNQMLIYLQHGLIACHHPVNFGISFWTNSILYSI